MEIYIVISTFAVKNGYVIGGQASFSFDANEKRAASSGCHTFSRKMSAFKAESESSFLLQKWLHSQ